MRLGFETFWVMPTHGGMSGGDWHSKTALNVANSETASGSPGKSSAGFAARCWSRARCRGAAMREMVMVAPVILGVLVLVFQ